MARIKKSEVAESTPVAAAPAKTKCPISRKQFKGGAKNLTVALSDGNGFSATVLASPKEFSTGSFGWGLSDKITVIVDGVPVKVQASVNLTVVNSKEAE